jgi:glutamate-ammonia-ligase adenylyltransferase
MQIHPEWQALAQAYSARKATASAAEKIGSKTNSGNEETNEFINQPFFLESLEKIKNFSPFLAHLWSNHQENLLPLFYLGSENYWNKFYADLELATKSIHKPENLMSHLRIAKQRLSLFLGWVDLTGCWSVERVTAALSSFATLALRRASACVLRRSADLEELQLNDLENPEKNSGFIILAMGKLGACELNYSSDIDIIVFYDPSRFTYIGNQTIQQCAIRLTRELVQIMEERTRDGYVFRTDLRLRPDPSSTPLALSTEAALRYYESVGQNWERAAFIKASAIAGDLEAGEDFLEELRPFIWRKYLDFAALQDIHSIKRQIASSKEDIPEQLYDYNIKLGHGGIREIEFFVQTQQLIWGGRQPELRVKSTCSALDSLCAAKKIEASTAQDLKNIYHFYRKLEHRLQMVADAQTHTLPNNPDAYRSIANSMDFEKETSFTSHLRKKLLAVQRRYSKLFKGAPNLSEGKSLVFTGVENDPETVANLKRMGFREPATTAQLIRQWHHGRHRCTNNKRARELLTELTPTILKAFADTLDPDRAFLHFDEFLEKLPVGIQPFSLFHAHPSVLNLIAELMGNFPYLADTLAHNPSLLEYILYPDFLTDLPQREILHESLGQAIGMLHDYEEVLNTVRRWVRERQFQVGVLLMRRQISTVSARIHLSDIADAVLLLLPPYVEHEFQLTQQQERKGNYAFLALGKLGSREMTFDSDLDLIFLYSTQAEDSSEQGGYFQRFIRRFLTACSTLTTEGRLYEVDMRLRPSGKDGPLATQEATFIKYYQEDAGAWEVERMALARARVLSLNTEFANQLEQALQCVVSQPIDIKAFAEKIVALREKITKLYPSNHHWAIKYVRGGLVDGEFLAQFFIILHAQKNPQLIGKSCADIFVELEEMQVLEKNEGDKLSYSYTLLLDTQTLLRMIYSRTPSEYHFTDGVRDFLCQSLRQQNMEALDEAILQAQKNILGAFEKYIGK